MNSAVSRSPDRLHAAVVGAFVGVRADFSPDDQKLVYQSEGAQTSNPEGDDEVYFIIADGSNQKNLSNNTANNLSPNWEVKAP
jgi:hypothetical protein